jgi:hypothetical protein
VKIEDIRWVLKTVENLEVGGKVARESVLRD